MGTLQRLLFAQSARLLRPWLSQPLGHFYSPIGDPSALAAGSDRLWGASAPESPVDMQAEAQRTLLRDVMPPLIQGWDYPEHADPADPTRYHLGNSQFSHADGRALQALLRHWRPSRFVEVGSGYSTLLAADVRRRHLPGMSLTAIEPFPRPFLHGLPGLDALRVEPVQDTPMAVFEALEAGDVLFIDSSHVLKTGSDLAHLVARVLPRLRSGVRIHFHDVFLPDEYPRQWVVDLNRSWNEQYVLEAMLVNGDRYRVVFATHFALTRLAADAAAAFSTLAGHPYAGGSLWIEVR